LGITGAGLNLLASIALVAAFVRVSRKGMPSPLPPVTVVALAFLLVSSALLGLAWMLAEPSALGPSIPVGLAIVALSVVPVLALSSAVAHRLVRSASSHLPRAVPGLLTLFPLLAAFLGVASSLAYSALSPLYLQWILTGLVAAMGILLVSASVLPAAPKSRHPEGHGNSK